MNLYPNAAGCDFTAGVFDLRRKALIAPVVVDEPVLRFPVFRLCWDLANGFFSYFSLKEMKAWAAMSTLARSAAANASVAAKSGARSDGRGGRLGAKL